MGNLGLRKRSKSGPGLFRQFWSSRLGRSAVVMVEFAFVGPIFFIFLLVIFETAYEQYLKSLLDTSLQATARQIQLGLAQGATTELSLANQYLCPNGLGFLNCKDVFIRVERMNVSGTGTACSGGASVADFYDDTNGKLPVSNGQLLLSLYGGTGATPASGANGPGYCDTASSASGFCVAGPSTGTQEFIILSAIYITPSFLGRLLSNSYSYNGSIVRAVSSDAAFITEGFTSTYTGPNGC